MEKRVHEEALPRLKEITRNDDWNFRRALEYDAIKKSHDKIYANQRRSYTKN